MVERRIREKPEAVAEVVAKEADAFAGFRRERGAELGIRPFVDCGAVEPNNLGDRAGRAFPDGPAEGSASATEVEPFLPGRRRCPVDRVGE